MPEQETGAIQTRDEDLLWRQLKFVPAFRGLLRAVEARFYQNLDLPQPMLDMGCGDGHFTHTAFNHAVQVGIDFDWAALSKAEKQAVYDLPLQATGAAIPFPDRFFGSAFSNSTLEHISEIQPVLSEINRVLMPGAPFVITVPSQNFTTYLGGAHFLNRIGLGNLSNSYKDLFNRISRHTHTDSPQVWAERLAQSGFAIERWQYYFSQEAMRAFEIGHVGSIPSALIHAMTGHWILGPWESNLKWTERWARPHYEEDFPKEGAYIFMLARKKAETSIPTFLPPAKPFTKLELNAAEHITPLDDSVRELHVVEDIAPQELSTSTAAETGADTEGKLTEPSVNWQPVIIGALALLALIFALFGQSNLQTAADEPGTGLGWFGLSALMLILLVWYQSPGQIDRPRIRLPSLRNIPQRRWLYLLALFLALIAPRFVAQGTQQRPGIAVFTWLIAITIAFFAFTEETRTTEEDEHLPPRANMRSDLVVGVVLFLAALLPRLFQLSSHPFVLNGSEASIGLDVLNVIQGTSRNPFSTAWLTNPTLPLYLLAVPIKLMGPSTLSIRLISPFVGAITVAAVFLIGRRLYGHTTGLIAAVLLLGSHFHVHYSRLGLTNVWDALLVLLGLGLIAIAWHMNPKNNRTTWLLAGLATGFNAYLYTSSHLLPIILVTLLLVTLLFERSTWRLQWRHIIAMAALAFVVALPQLLHYQANPDLFMERANILGILDSQGGWLSREAAQTETSQLQLLSGQLWRAALAFNATLDRGAYYGPSLPLLNFAAGVLAVLGFILALLHYRQLRFSMLVVWISTTIVFGGALIENPPNSHRFIIAAPAIMIVAALALVELANAVLGKTKKSGTEGEESIPSMQRIGIYLLFPLLIAAAIAFYDIAYYFGPYKTVHHFADRNTEIANDMADYLNTLEGDWSAYFFGPPSMYVGFSSIPFLVQDFQEGDNLFDVLEPGAQIPLSNSPNLTFIYLPERLAELEQTKSAFPDGQERVFEGYYANPLFHTYEIRRETQ